MNTFNYKNSKITERKQELSSTSVITIDKHKIEEILEEYAQAIDILGLAELMPIEDHQRKIKKIRKLQNILNGVTTITLDLK